MLATLIENHPTLSDWLFLIAVVLAVIVAVVTAPKVTAPTVDKWVGTLSALSLGCIAAGFLVL